MKNSLLLSLGLILGLSACDEMPNVSTTKGEASFRTLYEPEARTVDPKAARLMNNWLKAHPDATEGGGGCEMIQTEAGPTGTYWNIGRCCEDLDDEKTCEELSLQACNPKYGCGPMLP